MRSGDTEVHEFSETLLHDRVGESLAAKYLIGYLNKIGAGSILCEKHYVDRHYLDDFKNYYALSFAAPPPSCSRLHFFAKSRTKLDALIDLAYSSVDGRKKAEEELQQAYLGFVVVRPLGGAKVGRDRA